MEKFETKYPNWLLYSTGVDVLADNYKYAKLIVTCSTLGLSNCPWILDVVPNFLQSLEVQTLMNY